MAVDKDATLLLAIRCFLYNDKEDDKLSDILSSKVIQTSEDGYSFYLKLNNGVEATLSYNFDIYHIDLSNESLYVNNEDKTSPLSIDRIKWYIHRISQYEGEKISI
jgi:hypothetical protein